MLDNLNYIKNIDKHGMHKVLADFPNQFETACKICKNIEIEEFQPSEIVTAGMGGSGVGGELLASYASDICKVPIISCKSYDLPAFADENTLLFCTSYSGNTEETLVVAKKAIEKGCQIIAITSGGKLGRLCKQKEIVCIRIPAGLQPRCAIGYLFVPMLVALQKMYIIDAKLVNRELDATIEILKQLSAKLQVSVKTQSNIAKQLAYKLFGTYPIVYGHTYYRVVALRLRTQFNENAKILARDDFFPEQSHNDIVGWVGEFANNFTVLLLRDESEPAEIKKRIEITKRIAFKNAKQILEIWCRGDTKLSKMFYGLYAGDFTSFYLAMLRGVDPTPVRIIEKLKKMLAAFLEKS